VPLHGHFTCPTTEIIPIRDAFDNHPAVQKNHAAVEKKFAKEEEKLFHIHLPRFLVHFIPGLLIKPLQWEFDKRKGHICVDCTNGAIGPENPGYANTEMAVGQVFGSQLAPSFFSLESDIHTNLATTGSLVENYP
jgi:hypothetical protein